ncbi:MAG: polysaccharide deacetylase family protein, partial [Bacteroidales bacterium]|nr:polysaccharide deacetylase family protein [Bacteroidales bacterium]
YNHLQRFKTAPAAYLSNVYKARERIDSNLFRPPHGQITRNVSRVLRRDFTIVMWDVLTYDYDASMREEDIMNLLGKELRPGSIVVFHDSLKARDRVLKVLPKALEYWKLNGYSYGLL